MSAIAYRFHQIRYLVYQGFRDTFPFALFLAGLEISLDLFISNQSFLAQITQWSIYKQSWLVFLNQGLLNFAQLLLHFIASYFVADIIKHYLNHYHIKALMPSLLGFVTVWSLLEFGITIVTDNSRFLAQPFWLVLLLFSFVVTWISRFLDNRSCHLKTSLIILGLMGISILTNLMIFFPSINFNEHIQQTFASLMGNGPENLWQVMLWSVIGIVLLLGGFVVPSSLNFPHTYLTVFTENLNTTLSNTSDKLPYLYSLYTVRDSFAMVGGIGMLVSLAIAVIWESKHQQLKVKYGRIAWLSMIPLLFDHNLPFLLGLPILFQPILLVPMLLSTIMAEGIGALLLHLKWISPAVFTIPNGTPNLLLGFLASDGDWRYLIVNVLLIGLATLIYRPFIRLAFAREAKYHEKA
ncbi:PTS sugar transporter subunit IIC [Streptococcus sp. HF-1907]|uniref:PTS sugar transporter subunit IIC n=1 Tax=Streptococcus sp. HF-1907 TaxID=2785793 RepID=UPI00189E6BEF|nr:PTS sugar transporter subunit IIC [Streptococcus sp. HF-1907]MBF7094860.1 PTS sugar transporter subunit IIC [Streptococcus sp. HF-1907]